MPRLISVGRPSRFQLDHDIPVNGSIRARLLTGRREVFITGARRRGRTVSIVVTSSDVKRLGPSLAAQHDQATLRVFIDRRQVLVAPAVIRLLAHPSSSALPKSEPPTATAPVSGAASPAGVVQAGSPAVSGTSGDSSAGTVGLPTRLSWAPPQMSDPTTITAQDGLDPDHLTLNPSRDYIVKLPQGGLHGTLEIDGGHNVVLIGGTITVPATADQTDNGADDTDTALYVRGSTGTVHIEGVLIDAASDVMFDGIDVNAPQATVDVENVRVRGAYGSYSTEHADVIQTWGGARALRVDHLTADGDYQGLQIAPNLGSVGLADLRNVDLTLDPTPAALAASTSGGGHMIWLTRDTSSCEATPTSFSNVYVSNESNRVPNGDTVWPASGDGLPCAGVLAGGRVSWPALPVSGSVVLGPPPGGAFVPDGVAGDDYVSPGYLGG